MSKEEFLIAVGKEWDRFAEMGGMIDYRIFTYIDEKRCNFCIDIKIKSELLEKIQEEKVRQEEAKE